MKFIKKFEEIGIKDLPLVGGKNASLGEMIQQLTKKKILIPTGFTVTTETCGAYYKAGKEYPAEFWAQVDEKIKVTEEKMGMEFGSSPSTTPESRPACSLSMIERIS